MSKINKSVYPKNINTFRNDPLFYEELTVLKAQETIAELLESSNITKAELAKSLNQSKAHVTELLSEGRNLTLKTFARICFHLNAEINFQTNLIEKKYNIKNFASNKFFVSYESDIDYIHSLNKIKNSNTSWDNVSIKNFGTSWDNVSIDKIKSSFYKQDVKQFSKKNSGNFKVA